MAAWQADFTLVPASGALSAKYHDRLSAVLPRGRSRNNAIEQWGTEDGHRIDVLHDDDGTVEVFARFDMRVPDPALWERFLEFARAEGLLMEDAFGRRIIPVLGEFALALRGSPAFRFVEDPTAFLRRFHLGGIEDV
jgi:hypothetical protein